MKRMSCTGRFIRPFVRLLSSRHPGVLKASLERFRGLPRSSRVDLVAGHETLVHWVKVTGDEALGLKAGELMCVGESSVLEFALHSARSVREAMAVAMKYRKLLSDALEPGFAVIGDRAFIHLDNKLPWPRVVADFTMSAWYTVHLRRQLMEASDVECWFAFDAPADVSEYKRVFAPSTVMFGMPHYGFAFGASYADAPQAGADPGLHAMHCAYLESLGAGVSETNDLAPRVREVIVRQMRHGRPTAVSVARQLKISRRTLARRLEEEGTSFKGQLDDLRCELALGLVVSPQLSLTNISARLRFSRVQGFHRAFRRWTGQTPLQYRHSATQSGDGFELSAALHSRA
jgi:AraC-like DNA-binding protein